MIRVPYDVSVTPPAPVVALLIRLVMGGGWLQLVGLVDTGADITVIPQDIGERYLPVAGVVGLRGVTGDIEEAALFRTEMEVGGMRHVGLVAAFGTETIVGRDVLNRLVLELDGPGRELTVAAPRS